MPVHSPFSQVQRKGAKYTSTTVSFFFLARRSEKIFQRNAAAKGNKGR